MLNEYLGEVLVKNWTGTPFHNYKKHDWILYFVERYGQIDGAHHKLWVLDQIARICYGTPTIVTKASWSNGVTEFRVNLGEPPVAYHTWVTRMEADGVYAYDAGNPP